MNRRIERSYLLSEREVREAILAWLKAKDMPCPSYVGNTDTTTWQTAGDGSIQVQWTEQGEIE